MADHDRTRAHDEEPVDARADAHTETHTDGTARPELPVDLRKAVLDGMGGPSGMVYSAIPVVVFATAVAFLPLPVTIGISIAVALAIAALQLWRGKSLGAASGGVIAIVAAGGVSAMTGSANDFFLIGIWASLAGAVVMIASLVVRRPLTGVIWNAVHGGTHPWRGDRPSLRVHDFATFTVAVVFASRFVVREWLYLADSTGWLAFADIATGFPLTVPAALAVVWAFRRSTKRLVKSSGASATTRT